MYFMIKKMRRVANDPIHTKKQNTLSIFGHYQQRRSIFWRSAAQVHGNGVKEEIGESRDGSHGDEGIRLPEACDR